MTLADELLLLAYTDEGRAQISRPNLDYGLAGALLLELALADRVVMREGRLRVVDPRPIGDAVTDEAMSRIAADDKARRPGDWVQRLSRDLLDRVLDQLVDHGVLRREEGRVLWVFPSTRYPAAGGTEPAAERAARARLAAALAGDPPVDPRTAALAALVGALGLERKVFPDRPAKQVKARLKELVEATLADERWAADNVRKVIEEVEAAVAIAAASGAVAAAVAST